MGTKYCLLLIEFQANRITPSEMKKNCTVALDGVNLSKNRYTDVLPCMYHQW